MWHLEEERDGDKGNRDRKLRHVNLPSHCLYTDRQCGNLWEALRVSLTVLLSDFSNTFSKSQGITLGTVAAPSQVADVSDQGLVVLLLFIEGLGRVRKPLVQLWHAHSPHHQPANPSNSQCFRAGEKKSHAKTHNKELMYT